MSLGISLAPSGLATGEVWQTDRMLWHAIRHVDYTGHLADGNRIITPWPTRPPL